MRVGVDQAGHDDLAARRRSCRGPEAAAIASGVSTATMSRPSIATAPAARTRDAASIVTTIALVTTSEPSAALAPGRARTEPRPRRTQRRAHGLDRTALSWRIAISIRRAGDIRLLPFPPSCIVKPVSVHVVEHPLVHDALVTLRDARDAAGALPPDGRAHQPAAGRRGDARPAGVAGHGRRRRSARPDGRRVSGRRRRRAGAARRAGHARRDPGADARGRASAISACSATRAPRLRRRYYSKLPKGLGSSVVLMIDPMLATGGSAVAALDHLRRPAPATSA